MKQRSCDARTSLYHKAKDLRQPSNKVLVVVVASGWAPHNYVVVQGCSYPAVLQSDIEHVRRAAYEANPNAVEDHPLASLTDGLGQVLRPNCLDEGGKAAGHCLLWSTPGHHCSTKREGRE